MAAFVFVAVAHQPRASGQRGGARDLRRAGAPLLDLPAICEGGGTGRIVRGIAIIGLLASLTAIMQYGGNQQLLYGYWQPRDAGARPYGPFVNRNHFATWMIMACPLVFGYLLARAPAARERQTMLQRVVSAAKQLGSMRIWLAVAVCMMTLAVMISASRSGVIGLAAALAASVILSRGHHVPHTRRWTIFQAVLLILVVVSFANFDALSARVDETIQDMQAGRGRTAIWHDAERLIRDFPLTGTGAGTFGSAIGPYQTALPGFSLVNAHNHYLQLAAEGGALVTIPCALVLAELPATIPPAPGGRCKLERSGARRRRRGHHRRPCPKHLGNGIENAG